MFNEVKKTIKWGEETLTLETGKIARQADSCVLATLGETTVMAAVTFAKKEKPGQDFFPPLGRPQGVFTDRRPARPGLFPV